MKLKVLCESVCLNDSHLPLINVNLKSEEVIDAE